MEPESSRQALFASLYAELHRLARRELGRHPPARVSVTTLLHEAYLDMAARDLPAFPDEGHFLSYAARVMRGLIVDDARERGAAKRGGGVAFTTLASDAAASVVDPQELGAISDALDALAETDAALAELVDLKFFCGFSFAEIAALRGTSERTVQRNWEKARIYLHRTLRPGSPIPR
jgi:RNA polymerase sigma factor (TIGR02999 family)